MLPPLLLLVMVLSPPPLPEGSARRSARMLSTAATTCFPGRTRPVRCRFSIVAGKQNTKFGGKGRWYIRVSRGVAGMTT